MKIDIEKMREAVLAECETLDKEGIRLQMMHAGFTQLEKVGRVWTICIEHGERIDLDHVFQGYEFLYYALGLSERDAIAELREESDKYFTELKAERAKVAALQARKFMRVLDARTVKGSPDKVPMEILSNSHAEKHHGGQSLDKLNSRGGLSCLEIVANLRRVSPSSILSQVNDEMAVNEIKEAIKGHEQDSNKVTFLEKRNAALVAALEAIKQEHGYRYTYGDGFGNVADKRINSVGVAVDKALAANEKGGKDE